MQFKGRVFMMAGLSLFACLLVLSAEINAHIFSVIVNNQLLHQAPVWMTCLLTAILAVLPFFWFSKFSHLRSFFSICVYIIAIVSLVFSLVYFYKLWIPPAGLILATLLAYPLWSCGKINVAQIGLDQALQNLQDELTRLGMEQVAESPHGDEDLQQARIQKLALTAKHLREMHKSRSDTLAFISHDIRSPLGAAMLLLDKFEHNKYRDRIGRLLERAHSMAEGFLQASRAEMSDVNKFNELDIVSLTQQVVDDVYELLASKSITLEINHPEDNVWVRGDFGLLFRAISNVVLNAVNYSPEGSVIKVVIENDEATMRLKVTDQGPGIPEDKMQKLFKRFSRVECEHQDQSGSGLGLYFVGVTVRKHRGTVSASNCNMQGVEFVITLPLERRKSSLTVADDRRVKPEPTLEDTV